MWSIFCPVWMRHHLSFAQSLGIPERYENVNMEILTEIIQEEIIERLDLLLFQTSPSRLNGMIQYAFILFTKFAAKIKTFFESL